MATNRFKFKVLNGQDPNEQYAAIESKDALTFYLLNNGLGYLGETPLFGGSSQQTVVMMDEELSSAILGKVYILSNVTSTVGGNTETLTGMYSYNGTKMISYSDDLISTYISNILVEDMVNSFTPDHDTVPTTKAIFDYVEDMLDDSSLINAAFFRAVKSYTVTQDDVDDAATNPDSPFVGIPVGDVGLLFTADIDEDDGGEVYYYVSLQNYVTIYKASNTDSIHMSLDTSTNTFTASLHVKPTEDSLITDSDGVYIKKALAVDDENPDISNLISETALVNYIKNQVIPAVQEAIDTALEDVVTYTVDPVIK